MISILLSAALTFAVPSQQDGPARGQGPAFEVAVGSGEVAPALVAEVRELTAQRLDFLRPTFRGLEPQRFAVFVHGAAESLPPALAALRTLPEPQREVVACRVLLDLDTRATAHALAIPEGTSIGDDAY